jgi:transforming growth factor-beta-induced protein
MKFTAIFSALALAAATSSVLAQNIVEVATGAGLTTVVDVVVLAGLAGALTNGKANLTVLAPTNEAFAALGPEILATLTAPYNKDLLRKILLFHVFGDRYPGSVVLSLAGQNTPPTLEGSTHAVTVQSGNIFLGPARVLTPDVAFYNKKKLSVVHVINQVLVPPTVTIPTDTITELVVALNGQGQFTLLFKALTEYGDVLTDLLSSSRKRGLTVFAPTDEAFMDLPKRYRTFPLNKRCRQSLLKILKYHVVPRLVRSNQLSGTMRLRTLAGRSIDVDKRRSGFFVDDARIIQADIRATNGIIHVVNEVLMP